jgi:hypothetical protein
LSPFSTPLWNGARHSQRNIQRQLGNPAPESLPRNVLKEEMNKGAATHDRRNAFAG